MFFVSALGSVVGRSVVKHTGLAEGVINGSLVFSLVLYVAEINTQ